MPTQLSCARGDQKIPGTRFTVVTCLVAGSAFDPTVSRRCACAGEAARPWVTAVRQAGLERAGARFRGRPPAEDGLERLPDVSEHMEGMWREAGL